MRGWIQWFAEGIWRLKKPIVITVAVLAAYIGLVVWQNRPEARPQRTMNDPAFERAAGAICAKKVPPLRAVRREDDSDESLEKETAAQIERVATKLEAVVVELRDLEVKPANAAQVDAWFGHFDDYVAAGRAYAAALRGGNEDVYNRVDDRAIAPLEAISRFARANLIDACIP